MPAIRCTYMQRPAFELCSNRLRSELCGNATMRETSASHSPRPQTYFGLASLDIKWRRCSLLRGTNRFRTGFGSKSASRVPRRALLLAILPRAACSRPQWRTLQGFQGIQFHTSDSSSPPSVRQLRVPYSFWWHSHRWDYVEAILGARLLVIDSPQ